jgi:hypothetical protein
VSFLLSKLHKEHIIDDTADDTADDDVVKEGLSKLSDLAKEIFPEYIDKLSLSQFT